MSGLELIGWTSISAAAAPFLLLSFGITYVAVKLQDRSSDLHDPHLGQRAALYFLFSLSILVLLVGMTVLVTDFLIENVDKAPALGPPRVVRGTIDWTPMQRVAAALITAGGIFAILHLVVILAYDHGGPHSLVRRAFIGYRLVIHALVVFTAFTWLLLVIFQRDPNMDDLKPIVAVLLVWSPSWLIHFLLLQFARKERQLLRPLPARLVDDD
jgi:hypothetical protein